MSAFARPELVATPEWLADQLGRPDVRVLDVRWRPDGTGAAVFAAGHIPGAAHVDWRSELVESDSTETGPGLRLAGPERVAAAMSRAGIGDGTSLVIYDDSIALYAARAWWSLRAYGFESARILDGGLPAWLAEGRPLSNASYPPAQAVFTPRANPRLRLTTADVRALLGSPEVLLLDARAAAEYRGLEGNARRLGHIPGAINIPVGAMHVPGSQRLRDGAELRELLLKANVARGRRIITYDGAGVSAAKLAFILSLLGYEDVALYDGGWSEWGDRLDLPVDR
ncbi:MAG TPA: sulfurtransferase [Candidatus Limnocylindrales bacterium]|nr:sulfurtransferase [Candidatus Limnocylindrales bacterium]